MSDWSVIPYCTYEYYKLCSFLNFLRLYSSTTTHIWILFIELRISKTVNDICTVGDVGGPCTRVLQLIQNVLSINPWQQVSMFRVTLEMHDVSFFTLDKGEVYNWNANKMFNPLKVFGLLEIVLCLFSARTQIVFICPISDK